MAVLVSGVLLAVTFGMSAVAKLRDRAGGERAVAAFGFPAGWGPPLAILVPLVELAAAGALLFAPSRPAGAAVALALLSAFSVAIGWNLARGRRPSCHCFGALSDEPVGWPSVARNAFFGTLALFVLVGGGPVWSFAAVALACAICWLRPGVRRRWRERVGTAAERFALPTADGATCTLDGLLERGRPVLLVFSSPGCGGCEAVMPDVARWQQTEDARLTVAVLSGGPPGQSIAGADQHGLARLLVDEDQTVSRSFGVTVTPTALLLDPDGRVAAAPALGADEIQRLVAGTLAAATADPATRRVALRRVVVGASAVMFAPMLETVSSAGAALRRRRQVKVEGAWLCDQRYALCTTAACKPSPSDPGIAICECFVLDGYSMGYQTCAQRAPSARRVVSSFSTQNVNQEFSVMTCPASAPWATASTSSAGSVARTRPARSAPARSSRKDRRSRSEATARRTRAPR